MSQESKSKWFRFSNSFVSEHSFIYNRKDGNAFFGMYTKLLVLSLEKSGIILTNSSASTASSISSFVYEPDLELVNRFIKLLIEEKYMEILEDGSLFFPEFEKLVKTATTSAERKRKSREKKYIDEQNSNCEELSQKCHKNVTVSPPLNKIINKTPSRPLSDDSKIEQNTSVLRDFINNKGLIKHACARNFWSASKDDLLKVLKETGFVELRSVKEIEEWDEIIENCLQDSQPVVVLAAIIAAAGHKGKITNKINYFKRCFFNVQNSPKNYIENFESEIAGIREILKTPWLNSSTALGGNHE